MRPHSYLERGNYIQYQDLTFNHMCYILNHTQPLMLSAIFQLTFGVFISLSTAEISYKIRIRLNICVVYLMDIIAVWLIDTVSPPTPPSAVLRYVLYVSLKLIS